MNKGCYNLLVVAIHIISYFTLGLFIIILLKTWPTNYLFLFFLIILIFNFTVLYWFCHISTWICHRCTCVPHPEPSSLLPPHTIPLGRPSAPAPSIQYPASNLGFVFKRAPSPGPKQPREPGGQRRVKACGFHWCPAVTGLRFCPHVAQMAKKVQSPREVSASSPNSCFLEHPLYPEISEWGENYVRIKADAVYSRCELCLIMR